jgi:hypothetical protein
MRRMLYPAMLLPLTTVLWQAPEPTQSSKATFNHAGIAKRLLRPHSTRGRHDYFAGSGDY